MILLVSMLLVRGYACISVYFIVFIHVSVCLFHVSVRFDVLVCLCVIWPIRACQSWGASYFVLVCACLLVLARSCVLVRARIRNNMNK